MAEAAGVAGHMQPPWKLGLWKTEEPFPVQATQLLLLLGSRQLFPSKKRAQLR